VEEFKRIVPKGGGGTSYHVIFQYLQENLCLEQLKAILIFTDGHVWDRPAESAALNVPVIWLICKDGNVDVPWGQVVEL
jgi:predicted metal-dependent peptidase